MPESHTPRKVRLTSGHRAQLHTHRKPRTGDLVLIEYAGRPQIARHYQGGYLASSGKHDPQECRILGVLIVER